MVTSKIYIKIHILHTKERIRDLQNLLVCGQAYVLELVSRASRSESL